MSSQIRLSSVTFVNPTLTVELFGNIFAPSNGLGTRTVCVKILVRNLKGFWVQVEWKGYEKLSFSDQYLVLFLKRYNIWP